MPKDTAVTLSALLEELLQSPLPIRLRAWDGSVADPTARPSRPPTPSAAPSSSPTGTLSPTATPGSADERPASGSAGEPSTPGSVGEPTTPGSAREPTTPGSAREPTTPGSAREPTTPGSAGKPTTPGSAREPTPPGSAGEPTSRTSPGEPGEPGELIVRNRRALRRLLWQPNELGLARAYVSGDLDVEGDLYALLNRLAALLWEAPPDVTAHKRASSLRSIAGDLIRVGAVGLQPKPPPEEITLSGTRHSRRRDRTAISHHYDVGNDFYRIVLGESMVYSCAYWTSDAAGYGLADAQRDKLDLICRKLDLRPGMCLLDVGCGWGALAMHAARNYGVRVVGITLSAEQADYARKQVADAGLIGQVDIRVQDYRDVNDGPFDAIASVGMAEHVGTAPYADYAAILFAQLKPGGRLLNHQIAAIHPTPKQRKKRSFIDAYVFPDGELAPLGTTVSLLEEAGFEVRDVQTLREHYARTLRVWVANLESQWQKAVSLTSRGRARVWRLYMAASALAFEKAHIGVNQILAVKTLPTGASNIPPTRPTWT